MPENPTLPIEGSRFRFRLIGPFGVWREGVQLSATGIGSRKGRTLLKLLLVERGRLVSPDRIEEALWGEAAPATSDRLIATLVSRLRAVLGADALDGQGGGYRFVPSARLAVDLDEAERFVHEADARLSAGEPSLAHVAAERALEILGTGALLEDEPYAEWADGARTTTTRLLRRARGAAWRAALDLGDLKAALVAAEAAVEGDPLDEEAHRAVMLAHYRAGQPAEALAAHDRLRNLLADELGADPSPDTRALHVAILREAPLPVGAESTHRVEEASLEPSDPEFVGRDEEVSLLAGLWRDVARDHGRLVLVAGEAGIGKTRLAAEIVRLAETTGGAVAYARCYEAERSLFLQPFADAIRSVLVSTDPDVLREAVGQWAGTLGELVPEVGLILRPIGYQRAMPEIERRRSFEAVTAFLRSLGQRRPVLLFLDDLHQAGSSTLELLHFLARRASRARLLVLATIRAEEGEEALARLSDVGRRLDIGPLSDAAITELARRMGGANLVDRIVGMTRGHPLFAVETLRAIAERPPSADEGAVPESLLTAVMERVRRTGPEVEEVLRTGATLGSAFDLRVAASMLELTEEETGRRVERARRAGLIVDAGNAFEFANDLIREILYRTTPQPIRAARHRRAAVLLADNPEAVAEHASAAGDWATALEAWLRAADRAAARYANRDAELLLDRAVETARKVDDRTGEARARLARGRAREALAHYRQAHEDHTVALDLARAAADRPIEMRALRELGGDVLVGLGRPTRECLPYLEAALPIAQDMGDVAIQVDVLSRMAVIWTNRLRFDRAQEQAQRALELARISGDPRILALALDGMKTVSAYAGDLETMEPLLPELEPLLRGTGDLRLLQWMLFESSFPWVARGSWDRALSRIEEALELSRRTGYRAESALFVAHQGWIERSRGRYGAALAAGARAVELAEEIGHPWWIAFARTMLGWSLTEVGAIDEAIEHLEHGLEAAEREGSENYVVRCVAHLALAVQMASDRERAGDLLGRAETLLDGITTPDKGAFLHGAHSHAAVARAALSRGEPERAQRLLVPILSTAGPAGWREAAMEAAMLTGRARLAQGDHAGAELLLKQSTENGDEFELPRISWEGHAALAEALAAKGSADEAEAHRAAARSLVRSLADSIDDDAHRKGFLALTRRRIRATRR